MTLWSSPSPPHRRDPRKNHHHLNHDQAHNQKRRTHKTTNGNGGRQQCWQQSMMEFASKTFSTAMTMTRGSRRQCEVRFVKAKVGREDREEDEIR
ncbi:hypothetical protein TIFTF001_041294 [Ficus carica]|uniref:Uncharacterized protein n=1 Tax=Ficus carica TaxID=3494 RepID=A0AA88CT72_FICCA|nr:hypothetical protein TIFTF001_041289 [Ficus carica]GMN29257.1 hypothetical protein TIFTF001_041290 [Ficus carica]GMN29273.1 hypothetical protein TIFTF001_041293 [Ficus carica]GMN29284.1 hypothetical protein TIFTF001_041294 [Ficus carica]